MQTVISCFRTRHLAGERHTFHNAFLLHLLFSFCFASLLIQWLHDDGSWVSHDAFHTPTLEKAYTRLSSRAHSSSRTFIQLNVGLDTVRYQFDLREPTSAPQVAPDAPPGHPLCMVIGTQTNLRTMKTREIRRCTPATSPALQPSHFASHAADDALRAELILEAMQVLSKEFELCVMSVPPPNCAPDVPIDDLNELQSSLLSANFQASKSSARHEWNQLASEIPLVLDPRTSLGLFRKATGSAAEDLESMKKDRINGVERSRILEWAAAIAATQLKHKRRNALAIQVKHKIFLPPHKPARHIHSHPVFSQFSRDGVVEQGFGEAVTNSFFCDVAEEFSFGRACLRSSHC